MTPEQEAMFKKFEERFKLERTLLFSNYAKGKTVNMELLLLHVIASRGEIALKGE